MNLAYRNEGDVQPADSDRGQVGVVDVTDTRVASSKTTNALVQAVRFVFFIDRDNWLFPVAPLPPTACKALVSVSGYLIGSQAASVAPLPPQAEHAWWYQFYFATERGRAGYDRYWREFSRFIWQLASPRWAFDDATFARSAAALDNPDRVAIVIHNYRWRLGLAAGEPHYDDLERRLAGLPAIAVPTITLEGDANGAPHLDASAYADKFSGKYAHRTISGGVGHNLPQEAPQAFAQAIVDVDGF